jgi:hypothetical protein
VRTGSLPPKRPVGDRVLRYSVSPEVRYCVPTDSGLLVPCPKRALDHGEPEKVVVIDQAYIETNTPAIRDRLIKAGVRLAGLLNQALWD